MKIAAVLNVHSDPELAVDTLDSIFDHMTENVLVVVDGASWDQFKDIPLPAEKMSGFRHGVPKSPYRNVALGLYMLTERHPDMDWYCYCEEDVLFTSPRFRYNLKLAEQMDVWMLGSDGHVDDKEMKLVESLVGGKLTGCYYLLGCCQFFHKKFINKLKEINFFERFLNLTNEFPAGYFPNYEGYDISEHLYPTLARYFGGNIGVFATWDGEEKRWHGSHEYYPIRWKPELDPETENFPKASIMHPLKSYEHPIREFHRKVRNGSRKGIGPHHRHDVGASPEAKTSGHCERTSHQLHP